jgi:hypothetical protein
MKRFILITVLFLSGSLLKGQIPIENTISKSLNSSITYSDTLKSFLVKKTPPYVFKANLNHHERSLGHKILMGNLYSMGYNTIILSGLIFAPESLSKWENKEEKFKFSTIMSQYKSAYTKPPVIDEDLWVTNYLGHPYQGAFYYNSFRSQGATMWQSALFSLGRSLLWEYVWEAGIEQPSIQDLIVTPVVGSLLGEFTHVATIAMSKHGFKWYEIAAVCVINPAYAVNNGFRFNKPVKVH